ncbi:MAG: preprotein translocase subunit SecY [Chitinophagales bacterium]|jgi:preprotein translocase subunit SecY|nr:preprotein translocase subunit SecY [Chitinophagales bacterium]HNL06746.1 preprotein translocase subunit SecY [Chitinophagales bacterium]
MKNFIETIKNIFSIEELRDKLVLTLMLVFVYRIGSFIVLPGVDPQGLSALATSGSGGILGLLDVFVGGSFTRASVFALGIMPYISASIAIQLVTLVIPYFQRLQKEGESGRKKLNQLTRYLTIGVAVFQGIAYVTFLRNIATNAIPASINPFLFTLTTMFTLTAGTIFCLWLAERITDKGIGNGTSMLIMAGIMARLPFAFFAEFQQKMASGGGGLIAFAVELVILALIVLGTILLVQGVRRIPVQYAKRIVGNKQYGGQRQFIPLRVNAAGVMPIIFAQALMFIPSFVAQLAPNSPLMQSMMAGGRYDHTIWYNVIFFALVVLFTYFYTAIIVNPTQMAEDMKRNNGFIPGVKPGQPTADYIDEVTSRITLPGAVGLALVAILPAFASRAGVTDQFASFFGGTSLLIAIAVMLDTLQQIESHLLMRQYDGLMKGGSRIKGRYSASLEGSNQYMN